MTKTRCEHDLRPIRVEPTEANSTKVRTAWLFISNWTLRLRRCAKCGAMGSISGGYSKGGGHKFIEHPVSDKSLAEADAWNARVAADLATPEMFDFQKVQA